MTGLRILILVFLGLFVIGLRPPRPYGPQQAEPVYEVVQSPTPPAFAQTSVLLGLHQAETTKWQGQYYNNATLTEPPANTREDGCLDFDWGTTSPWPGVVGTDEFSIRWTRNQFFEEGLYRFYLRTDDGAKFWIDPEVNNFTIIDGWNDQAPTLFTNDVQLQRGTNSLKIEYYDRVFGAQLSFWWEKLGTYPNWKAEYYKFFDQPRLCGGAVKTDNELAIDHEWGFGSPSSALGTDFWAARWTGVPTFVGGLTRFFTVSDDGVRLWVDANNDGIFDDGHELVIDRWINQSRTLWSGDIYVSPGAHGVKLEYYELVGEATIKLWWRNW